MMMMMMKVIFLICSRFIFKILVIAKMRRRFIVVSEKPSASFTVVHKICRMQVHLPSWPAHHVRPQGPTCQKIFSNPQSTQHPLYITFFPLRGNIHLSLNYECRQNFLASLLEPKNTNHSSHMLSPTIDFIIVFFSSVFIVFFVFVFLCLLCTIFFSLWLLLSINDDDFGRLLEIKAFKLKF